MSSENKLSCVLDLSPIRTSQELTRNFGIRSSKFETTMTTGTMEDWNVGVMEKTTICSFIHYSIILLFHHSTFPQNLTPETCPSHSLHTRHFTPVTFSQSRRLLHSRNLPRAVDDRWRLFLGPVHTQHQDELFLRCGQPVRFFIFAR